MMGSIVRPMDRASPRLSCNQLAMARVCEMPLVAPTMIVFERERIRNDLSGSYQPVLLAATMTFPAAAICFLSLGRFQPVHQSRH